MSAETPGITPAEQYLLDLEQFGMRFGLRRITRLLELLDSPHEDFPTIHVVGTNGKSSVTRMIAAVIGAHGFRCGAFTSPHLLSFRERIELEGRPIVASDFDRVIRRVRAAAEIVNLGAEADDRVTQFEALTAAAYLSMAEARVEVGVIEAGLGGRLDSTNVIDSAVQVLTGVSLDHTDLLGETVEEIATEKLAVVRDGAVLIVGDVSSDVAELARQVADDRGAKLVSAAGQENAIARREPGFHASNAAVALAAAEQFIDRCLGGGFDRSSAVEAILDLIEQGGLRGRMQLVAERPSVIFDAAHNPEAADALTAAIKLLDDARPLIFVVGMLSGKQAEKALTAFAQVADQIICTAMTNPRALAPTALAAFARGAACRADGTSPMIETVDNPTAALRIARDAAGSNGRVVVTGSNYLLSELMSEPDTARSVL